MFDQIKLLTPDELEADTSSAAAAPEQGEKNSNPIDPNQLTLITDTEDIPSVDEEGNPVNITTTQTTTSKAGPVKGNLFQTLVDELLEEGMLEKAGEEPLKVTSAKELKALWEETINKKAETTVNEYKGSFSGAKKVFLDIEDLFDDDTIAIKVAQELDYFKNIKEDTLEEEAVVDSVLARYYANKGFTPDQIKEQIVQDKAVEKAVEKAKKYLPEINAAGEAFITKRREAIEAQENAIKETNSKKLTNILNTIDTVETRIPVNVTAATKKAMKSAFETIVHEEDGRKFNAIGYKQHLDPAGFNSLLLFLEVNGVFELDKKENQIKPNFGKLLKLVEKQTDSKLEKMAQEGLTSDVAMRASTNDSFLDAWRNAQNKS